MNIKTLIGSGDKIMPPIVPLLIVGIYLNYLYPGFFGVGGPNPVLAIIAWIMLVPGVLIWLSSVILILTRVPKGELITGGPFALVKHPLYTGVSLLVFPAAGFLFNSWLGAAVGIIMYALSRRYAPAEEVILAKAFGPAWDEYAGKVLLPWL
jgi:protein-S-isoprenylcysteine O-methyltransferase Ste14